ncbi:hypothetical protein D3C72_1733630 [compost metagenome]
MPVVSTRPPSIASVPPALVVTEAAYTALASVVAPLLLMASAPRRALASSPTLPDSVTLPRPALTVRPWPSPSVLAMAPPKLTLLPAAPLVSSTRSSDSVTLP